MSDLQLLFDNKIDSIITDDLLSSQQIKTFFSVIENEPEWQKSKLDKIEDRLFPDTPTPQHLFISQYGLVYLGLDEDGYLKKSHEYKKTWDEITTKCGFDIFELLVSYLKKQYQVDVKIASKNQLNYFPLTIRNLSTAVLPHADFGPYDGPDWQINQVIKQLAWNIYLTDPGQGGETIVYDHQWSNTEIMDDNSYGIKGFNKPVKTTFSVKPARLVLFNSRNFHEVRPSSQPRIAIGGLIGQTKTGDIIAWD